jgi:competence protein ComEC
LFIFSPHTKGVKISLSSFCLLSAVVVVSVITLRSDKSRMVLLDVGQGDAIYIRSPAGHDILIDAGPTAKVVEALQEQMPRGDRTLEMVIATHLDADHIGGFPAIFEALEVEQVVTNGADSTTKTGDSFFQAIQAEGITATELGYGQRIEMPGLYMDVVWPTQEYQSDETNERALVLRLHTAKETVLLTSDVSSGIERKLLERHSPLSATILKVGHHGSKNSSSESFLKAVHAVRAGVSVAEKNRYGHPASETLERLQNIGLEVARTDQAGSVTFPLQ